MRQNPIPGPVAPPTIQPIRTGLPGSVAFGQITPWCSRAQFPQNAVDNRVMVALLPSPPSATAWQQRRDGAPGLLGQFASPHHLAFLVLSSLRTRVTHLVLFV